MPRRASLRPIARGRSRQAGLRQVNPVTGPVSDRRREAGRRAEGHGAVASSRRAGAGPATSRASACSPTSSPNAALHHLALRPGLTPAMYGPGGRVPLRPFTGTIGVAPAEPGLHSIIPPRNVGGNMDVARHRRGHRALPAGRGRRARCSRSATPMPRRATARSAARRSKARSTSR